MCLALFVKSKFVLLPPFFHSCIYFCLVMKLVCICLWISNSLERVDPWCMWCILGMFLLIALNSLKPMYTASEPILNPQPATGTLGSWNMWYYCNTLFFSSLTKGSRLLHKEIQIRNADKLPWKKCWHFFSTPQGQSDPQSSSFFLLPVTGKSLDRGAVRFWPVLFCSLK